MALSSAIELFRQVAKRWSQSRYPPVFSASSTFAATSSPVRMQSASTFLTRSTGMRSFAIVNMITPRPAVSPQYGAREFGPIVTESDAVRSPRHPENYPHGRVTPYRTLAGPWPEPVFQHWILPDCQMADDPLGVRLPTPLSVVCSSVLDGHMVVLAAEIGWGLSRSVMPGGWEFYLAEPALISAS